MAIPTDKELFIKMTVSAWETQVARVTKLIDSLSDEQLMAETAPGRNRGIYLLGHLTAVSDHMQTLIGWGERLYPQLENIYIKNPDKSGIEGPSINQLKDYSSKVNEKITQHISTMPATEWFARHTAVTEEDFAKEPHRNKLNILISRTNHLSYHWGQIVYLSKK